VLNFRPVLFLPRRVEEEWKREEASLATVANKEAAFLVIDKVSSTSRTFGAAISFLGDTRGESGESR